jgi:hypothetical protein
MALSSMAVANGFIAAALARAKQKETGSRFSGM